MFQCLLLDGENVGPEALRNGERFYITNEAFDCFLERHKHVKCLVPESNVNMQNSYLILDEYVSIILILRKCVSFVVELFFLTDEIS